MLFEDKYEPVSESGCWIWSDALSTGGYGQYWTGDKAVMAHRYSYEKAGNDIPNGMEIDHLCRVRCCVNPAHLEPVTRAENMRRAVPFRSETTHCKHGHEYKPENTYINKKTGVKQCKECHRLREAKRRGSK